MGLARFNIYVVTILFALTLYMHVSRKENRYYGSYQYFRAVVFATLVLVCLETLSWVFEGLQAPGAIIFNYGFNTLMYYFSAIPITLWFIYFDEKYFQSKRVLQIKRSLYIAVNLIMFLLTTINLVTPILFEIDTSNHYVRKGGLLLIGSLQILYLFLYILIAFFQRKKIPQRVFHLIAMVSILPILSMFIQVLNMDFIILCPILVYITFLAFIVIERQEMIKDVLTGLSLRRHLEGRLIYLLEKEKDFTLILIDLNDFKKVNDLYGHMIGDQVLIDFSEMIKKSIHHIDEAFRYAGDEFVILFKGHSPIVTDSILSKLKIQMKSYNENQDLEVNLSMSYGILTVEGHTHQTLREIIHKVDLMMYEDKKMKKQDHM
ncbi:MAG: GGDEF domain-containing protein [Clostridia bacterium]|nr:GGDEF domain-containing protein [Clostridia bacterium]